MSLEPERASALYALTDIRTLDKDRARQTFIRLSSDPSSDVRWRVPDGLKDQLARADVKEVMAALLKDLSPEVRYFTIFVVGPEKHIEEIEELARGSGEIAEWAKKWLQQITKERQPKP